ncbi:MAG: chemotaxis protein CheB [Pseudomonadota bacterium]
MNRANIETRPFWVGIGASAGGLEALRELAQNLMPDLGAIYVIAQHMSPQHKSLLTELIARETELDVVEITDGIVPKPDTIYVVPPNHDVIVKNRRLHLRPPSDELASPKPSVDRFLRSMAENLADRAIGVVLSGTGSDGAYGIQAVRAAGGITIVQNEDTAKYFGMPQAALATGCVDLVLSPGQIGSQFARISRLPRDLSGIDGQSDSHDTLSKLFKMLLSETRVDFREYKSSTVRRRIERRMTALDLPDLEAYVAYAEDHSDEMNSLFRDLMISVTSFFRDPEEFESLREQVDAHFKKIDDEGLRVWVAGCASGEEAYSIAMLLVESLGGWDNFDETKLQIFATDIDKTALAAGRRGFYLDAAISGVPEEYLEKYFDRMSGGYQVKKALRDRIMFTPHNLCNDPPFSNIDLISCRNLLIYFNSVLQNKVVQRLHYALNSNGLLFIGKSEPIVGSGELFQPMAQGLRVLRRRVRSDLGRQRGSPLAPSLTPNALAIKSIRQERANEVAHAMFDSLVNMLGPNAIIVSSDLHIRKIYGSINRYVSLGEGIVRGATIAFLRPEIRHQVRILTTLALRNGESRVGPEQILPEDSKDRLQIHVHPIANVQGAEDVALVVFKSWTKPATPVIAEGEEAKGKDERVEELEGELKMIRETLHQTVEELETTNEELQILNEELQSANEELQSNNEELETVNEELQSTNEELITVNEELQVNSHELTVLNQELDSILSNIAAPIIVVDAGLHIVRCSQNARNLFDIDPMVGRPHLSQCTLPEGFPSLTVLMSKIIQSGDRAECTIDTPSFAGSVVAAPYFSSKGELIGATAIVSDTSEMGARAELELLLDNVPLMIWRKDDKNTVLNLNDAAAHFMRTTRSAAIGCNLSDFLPGIAEAEFRDDLQTIKEKKPRVGMIEKVTLGDAGAVWLSKSKVPYTSPGGAQGVYVVAQDITSEHLERMDVRRRSILMERMIDALPAGVEFIDGDGVLRLQNATSRRLTGEREIDAVWEPGSEGLKLIDDKTGKPKALEHHPALGSLSGNGDGGGRFCAEIEVDGAPPIKAKGVARRVESADGKLMGVVNMLLEMEDQEPPAE